MPKVFGITLTSEGGASVYRRSTDAHDFFILDWNNTVNRGKKHIANNVISNQQYVVWVICIYIYIYSIYSDDRSLLLRDYLITENTLTK